MPIFATTYKSRPAFAVSTSAMTAVFLPQDGGKLASVKATDGFEFLCENPAPGYTPLAYDGVYVQAECASFDDLFPTVDPYTPSEGAYRGVTYPDHGEVCRLPYEAELRGDTLILTAASRIFPLSYRKDISACPDGSVAVRYCIQNGGEHPFPYIWAAHCMLRGQDDLRLVTPYPPDAPKTYMFGATADEGLPTHALMGHTRGGRAYKYYFDEPSDGGFVGGVYAASGHRFELDFGTPYGSALPYLGIWINNGSFKGYYNIALECATAPCDSPQRAMERGYCSELPPHGEFTFVLRIRVDG